MSPIKPDAEKAREDARTQTGEFGIQTHAESGIVPLEVAPQQFGDAIRDLEAWMGSDEPFAIRVLIGARAESLLQQLEKQQGASAYTNSVLGDDARISTTSDGPLVASYRFPVATPEAFAVRADDVAITLRGIPHVRAAMGMHTPASLEGRTRVVLVVPVPVPVLPTARPGQTQEEQMIAGVRPFDDDSVNDLLDKATLTVVADFTPWCSEPDDHCVGGDCYYGNHGPLTAEAENDLRAGGYGWVLDDPEEGTDG